MSDLEPTVKFIGSYPEDDTESAMRAQIELGEDRVHEISDGETGDRQNWVVAQIEDLDENDAFVKTKRGRWTHYGDCPEYDVAPGHTLVPGDFQLRYHQNAAAAWPILDRLREEYQRPDLMLQMGVPHHFDMSLATFGTERGMRPDYMEAYAQANVEQIQLVHGEDFGDQVVVQIETPYSMGMASMDQEALPEALRIESLARYIADLAERSPEGMQFGIHLCMGDLNNESRGQLPNRAAPVALMNAIAQQEVWHGAQKLLYIHDPIAAGKNPPIMDRAVYRELRDLRLPVGTRYIAGLVHEQADLAEQEQVVAWVQEALPENQTLGLATACGMGRRRARIARLLSQRATTLARHASLRQD